MDRHRQPGDVPGRLGGRQPAGWNDFVPVYDDLAEKMGLDDLPGRQRYRSSEYTVTANELEDGTTWLSISRYGIRGRIRNWRHLQVIKNELCGPEREAIELFPAESRLVDTVDQFHLWVLPEGRRVEYGYRDRDVGGPTAARAGGGRQTPFDEGCEPPEGPDPDPPLNAHAETMVGPKPVWFDIVAQAAERARRRGRR